MEHPSGGATLGFSVFEIDMRSGELRKRGVRVPLQQQPFRILVRLVERPGEIVTREALREELWAADTYVDFERGINAAVKRLREALGDSAETPRFIETLPKRGYRFIAGVRHTAIPDQRLALDAPSGDAGMGEVILGRPAVEPYAAPHTRPTRRAAYGLAALVAGGLALWLGLRARDQPAPAMRESQLTAYEGFETQPAFSPDGNRVVFVWDRDGANRDIYVRLIEASEPVPLANTPEPEFSPAWSPDGLWIAFLRGSLLNASVFVMPSIGGVERKIAESGPAGVIGGTVRWSPDGKWLLVSGTTETDQSVGLVLIKVSTGENRRLTSPPAPTVDLGGSFSPDASQIVFLRQHNQTLQGHIHLLHIDPSFRAVGDATPLKTDGSQMGPPVWTRDGRELVFPSVQAGRSGLWRVSVAGGTPVRIPVTGNDVGEATIRGTRLLYVQQVSDTNIWAIATSGTGETVRLVASTLNDAAPQYSPDGTRIAFCSEQTGSQEIWVARSDGSHQQKLTAFGSGRSCTPRWSPDSRQLVFDSDAEAAQFEIYTINADRGQPRRLTRDPANDSIPSFSHDGKWIYFMSSRSGRNEIWKLAQAGGGEAHPVTSNGGLVAFESANRLTLFFQKEAHRALWQMPVGGGPESKVLEHVAARNFIPAEDGIYFMQRTDHGHSFQFLDFATGQVRTFGSTTRRIGNVVTVSADGRWFAYGQQDHGGSDIALVDNFR
jgi:Tol biopolymer transport system component/DNA-binding winged helix-turn-helix (wHTH) protein